VYDGGDSPRLAEAADTDKEWRPDDDDAAATLHINIIYANMNILYTGQ